MTWTRGFPLGRTLLASSLAVVAAAAMAGCSSGSTSSATSGSSPAAGLQPIPITIKEMPIGLEPTVQITIGNSAPLTVLLDTGSPGLRVSAQALQGVTGITALTDSNDQLAYADGSQFTGTRANAEMKIGANPTAGSILFQSVESLGCTSSKPKCPTAGGLSALETNQGIVGIMGVSVMPDGEVFSPLLQLRAGIPDSWTVTVDSLTSGTLSFNTPPASPLASFPMPPASGGVTAYPNGAPAWADIETDVCWSVGTAAAKCIPTAFDTGTPELVLASGTPGTTGSEVLPAGSKINLTEPTGVESPTPKSGPPAITHASDAAGTFGQANVGTSPQAVAGLALLSSYPPTYDVKNGTILLANGN